MLDPFTNFLQTLLMEKFVKSESVEVLEGVYLTRSEVSPVWQTYFRWNGKTYRKSTKKRDFTQAKMVALGMFYDAQRNEQIGPEPKAVPFAKLAQVYEAYVSKRMTSRYHVDTLKRHLMPYFGEVKDVRSIDQGMVTRYVDWRLTKSDRTPTPQTLNRENTVLRQVLEHAVEQGWIEKAAKVPHFSERLTRRRRRHFTTEEYRALHRTARKRITRAKNDPLQRHTLWQRQLLYDVIILIANSSLRVDELQTLRWRNVDFESEMVVLERAGKTKSSRRVIVRSSGMVAMKRIKERRRDWLDGQGREDRIEAHDPVIALPTGTTIKSFATGFDGLLTECGFVYETSDQKHSMTSLRHTYATFSLTRKRGKRAGMRALAKQMGTSERMIQQHYGHDEISDYEEELRG